ncbi:choice-of-anchor I family protein [Marinicrinis lubricantis]|uniref:Choice-of-anchor I family protein n=1 Tax=Marinicrinis lubricantis TaxID=2086470 RepID=A0ABW1IQ11_9BACL
MKTLKLSVLSLGMAALLATMAPPAKAAEEVSILDYGTGDELSVELIGRYESGAEFAEGGTEIVVYDAKHQRMFSVNGAEKALDIMDLSTLQSEGGVQSISLMKRIALNELHSSLSSIDDITSVAKHPTEDYIAIAVTADPKQDPGYVVFLDVDGKYLGHVQAGPLPDMVTFTPDGTKVLVANEGEPTDDYKHNPEGSVTIIDVSAGVQHAAANTASFQNVPMTGEVRKSNPEHTYEQNFEPEYIVVSSDSQTAYVAFQESNAIAVMDMGTGQFKQVYGLGYKDWSAGNNVLDVTDKDGKAELKHWPVLGMYMPDGMSIIEVGGKDYIITPNEGDSADYEGYSEEERVADMAEQYALNADLYEGYTQSELDELVNGGLFNEDQLGRLKTTTSAPKNEEGKYEAIYSYGGRSFSIWDAEDMSLVYDSGGDFETITSEAMPEFFNSDNEENNFDGRSDDKGPEPETAASGIVGGVPYAFIGLERTGGIMVYDVTNPAAPQFVKYFSSRDLSSEEVGGDIGPEGLTFVPAVDSPTGKALLLAAHEVSGTIAVYEITPKQTAIQLIHVNDVHSRILEDSNAGMGYAKLAAVVNEYSGNNPNTLLLDAGDSFHGQTFSTLVRGESIVQIMNEMGFDALTAGNHDFNYGIDRLLELAELSEFPVLGGNVDKAGQDVLPASFITEIDGIRIGIFGLSTPETAYKTHPNNVEGITFVNPIEEAKKQVELLKNQVDVIVALNHLGMDEASTYTSDKVAEQVDGIDVIIDGHSHQIITQTINDTLIVQTGEYLKNVGVVTLTFEEGQLTGKTSKLISKEEMAEADPDPEVAELISSIQASQDEVLSEVVGATDALLDGERTTVRVKESNLGNLITDAMLMATGADVALTNGGGIRASIDQGDITKGDIITVLPFGNYIVTLEVTGADIVAALQHGAGDYPEPKGAFPQVGGITYAIDPSQPKGSKVHSVKVNGEPIDLNRIYVLATNDFIAAGGDEYTMFADDEITGHYPALDEAVISYIQSQNALAAAVEGRIIEQSASGDKAAPAPVEVPAEVPVEVPNQLPSDNGDRLDGKYIVKQGDTLYSIGRKYGVSWKEIAEYNRLSNPNLIFPNQTILIPAE